MAFLATTTWAAMNGSGSSSHCACPTRCSTRSSAGSASELRDVRIVPREHLHVTLAFLGHRPAGELDSIVGALRDAAARAGEIRLTPVRYRETRSAGMLVLEDDGGSAALLAGDVQERLEQLGVYRREDRAWLPHLTVARWRSVPRLRLEPPPVRTFVPSDAAAYLSRLQPERGAVRGLGICRSRRLGEVDKHEALDVALGQIERQFGKGSVMKMNDRAAVSVGAVSTGSLALDLALGIGGLPRGRIVEIFGPESSGKTTLVYHVIAEAQRRGGICAFIDAEHAMDPAYAKRIGVDIDNLLVSQPDTGEQALEIAELLIRSGALDVVAIDSVAALTPKAEIEGEMGDTHVGLQARLMSQALRKLAGTLNRTDTICLFTNQLREKIGVMFGNPETTPGGRALKFYSSVRLDIRRIETLKDGVEAFGNRVRVKVVKNKVAPPFKQAEFDIIYGSGISWEGTVLDSGLERKVVTKSGSYFSFGDERLGQGRQNATAFLREHPDVTQQILQAIQAGARLGPDRVGAAAAGRRRGVRGERTARRRWRRRRSRRPKPRRDPDRHGAARAEARPGRRRARRPAVACAADGCGRTGRARGRAPARPAHGEGARARDSPGARRWPRRRDRSLRATAPRRALEQRLARAGHSAAAREDALESLGRAGLVDDVRLAESRAELLARRGYGDAAIRADLRRRLIGAETADRRGRRRSSPSSTACRAGTRAAETSRRRSCDVSPERGFSRDTLDEIASSFALEA